MIISEIEGANILDPRLDNCGDTGGLIYSSAVDEAMEVSFDLSSLMVMSELVRADNVRSARRADCGVGRVEGVS